MIDCKARGRVCNLLRFVSALQREPASSSHNRQNPGQVQSRPHGQSRPTKFCFCHGQIISPSFGGFCRMSMLPVFVGARSTVTFRQIGRRPGGKSFL